MSKGTRDYAKKNNNHSQKRKMQKPKKKAMFRMTLTTSVLIGLFVLGLFYLHKMSAPVVNKPAMVQKKKTIVATKASKPRFEFYSILPKTNEKNAVYKYDDSTQAAKSYLIQVAALKNAIDAERLKAELTLLGFDVNLQRIVSNGAKWNRVSLGPYTSVAEAEKAQRRLRKSKYKSILRVIN